MYDVLSITSRERRTSRPGFTLVEILVAFTILGIIGVIFVRLLLTQGRFTDQQNALRGARSVSRQALNILESEIRMVQDSGGIDSASADGRTIRVLVPYRFGINCGVQGGRTVVSMLPADSLALAQSRYVGFAWRAGSGRYRTVFPTAPLGSDSPFPAKTPSQCNGTGKDDAQVKTLTINGRAGSILDLTPPQGGAPVGQPVFLFQRITYTFKASTAFPGQFGLFRTAQGGPSEELMAPFDSTARFKYWAQGASASVSAPPALGLIRGIDVVMAAQSNYTPLGKAAPIKSTLIASIFFKNVR